MRIETLSPLARAARRLCGEPMAVDWADTLLRWDFDCSDLDPFGTLLSDWRPDDLARGSSTVSVGADPGARAAVERIAGPAAAEFASSGRVLAIDRHPALDGVAAAFAGVFGADPAHVTCSILATSRGGVVPWHFDIASTIAFQVRGRKRWSFRDNELVDQPTSGWVLGEDVSADLRLCAGDEFPTAPLRGGVEEVATPGRALSVPRGSWHATEALDDSLSLNVHLARPTRTEIVLPVLRRVLSQHVFWRSLADSAPSADDLETLLADLRHHVSRLQPADFLGRSAESLEPSRPQSAFWKNPAATIGVDSVERGVCTIHLPAAVGLRTLQIALDPAMLPACTWLREQTATVTAECVAHAVPNISVEGASELLNALEGTGFVQRVAAPRGAREPIARRPSDHPAAAIRSAPRSPSVLAEPAKSPFHL